MAQDAHARAAGRYRAAQALQVTGQPGLSGSSNSDRGGGHIHSGRGYASASQQPQLLGGPGPSPGRGLSVNQGD